MWLWMVTAVALALAGSVFGGRIAYHVVAGDRAPRAGAGWGGVLERSAPWLAAGFAAASVLGLQDYMHYVLSVQSDPVIRDVHAGRGRQPPATAAALGLLARCAGCAGPPRGVVPARAVFDLPVVARSLAARAGGRWLAADSCSCGSEFRRSPTTARSCPRSSRWARRASCATIRSRDASPLLGPLQPAALGGDGRHHDLGRGAPRSGGPGARARRQRSGW